jgi:uncharacterized hydrophobic protein (TIGR00271 family)
MPTTVTTEDIDRMTDALFIERSWRSPSASRFWVLLVLATIIATAGVMADSTATVIGAMIVAPLMTPILGIALAIVLGDRSALLRSIAYVAGGALVVIGIAFLIGQLGSDIDAYAANSQVAGRISPRLIDLVGALATGTVGAFALVRRDISDTLPGVAIAISLVPPLAVVGLLLGVGRYADASQALLPGTLLLRFYRVRDAAVAAGRQATNFGRKTLALVVALVVLVAIPLGIGSFNVAFDQLTATKARPVASAWAAKSGWQVATVEVVNRTIVVTALGPPPEVKVEDLRKELNDAGLAANDLAIRLVVGGTRFCAAQGTTCIARTGLTS